MPGQTDLRWSLVHGAQESELARLEYGLTAVHGVELLRGIVNVEADGGAAARKNGRDFTIGLAHGRPAQTLDFPLAQADVVADPALRLHYADVAADELSRKDAQQIAVLFKFLRQVGSMRADGIEAHRADLTIRQMNGDDDRDFGHRAFAEIGQIERSQMGIVLLGVKAALVAPKRLAFISAGQRQRRSERQTGSFPPAFD